MACSQANFQLSAAVKDSESVIDVTDLSDMSIQIVVAQLNTMKLVALNFRYSLRE